MRFVKISLLLLILGIYVDSWELDHQAVDHTAKSLGRQEPIYAVVIDAGSTGSRVLAFSFHKAFADGRLILDHELYVETEPGLSAFAENPEEGAKSIDTLLERAKNEIPEKYWNKTPLVLKATAGLRLLPAKQAEGLLNAVRNLFKKSPFLTNDDSVTIIDGADEGIFGWITVNFLLDRLGGDSNRIVAALDLGGGSTQVSFAPKTNSTLQQKEYIHNVSTVEGIIPVYTRSYLGLGLMTARKEILTVNHEATARNLSSVCMNNFINNKKFLYEGIEYSVSGDDRYASTNSPEVNFEDCVKIITDYVHSQVVPLHELHTKEITAFSYYFDRALESGLIDPYEGGVIQVKQFSYSAKKACKAINVDTPFECFDLTYIWILLEHGFGLQPETKLSLYRKIQGHEISWALGAALDILKQNEFL